MISSQPAELSYTQGKFLGTTIRALLWRRNTRTEVTREAQPHPPFIFPSPAALTMVRWFSGVYWQVEWGLDAAAAWWEQHHPTGGSSRTSCCNHFTKNAAWTWVLPAWGILHSQATPVNTGPKSQLHPHHTPNSPCSVTCNTDICKYVFSVIPGLSSRVRVTKTSCEAFQGFLWDLTCSVFVWNSLSSSSVRGRKLSSFSGYSCQPIAFSNLNDF